MNSNLLLILIVSWTNRFMKSGVQIKLFLCFEFCSPDFMSNRFGLAGARLKHLGPGNRWCYSSSLQFDRRHGRHVHYALDFKVYQSILYIENAVKLFHLNIISRVVPPFPFPNPFVFDLNQKCTEIMYLIMFSKYNY